MTTAVNTLALANLNNTTLAQLIPIETVASSLPCRFTFDDKSLSIDANIALNITSQSMKIQATEAENITATELVVFSDLTIEQLVNLSKACQIQILSLAAINNRNNLISYRFNVTTSNIALARQHLVAFNLANKLESILIINAPKLNMPGVLLMDMDSTTIKIECIDELAKLAGVGEQVAEVTELAMQGKLDFAQSLHQRVGTLAGAPVSILEAVVNKLPLMEGLETLISQLQKHHWRVAIASGGFTYFADHLKQLLNLDSAVANTLEIIDDKLTGKVLGDVVDAQAKADNLVALAKQYNIEYSQTVAMGDGANDLVMMEAAGLGVAFHAKQLVVDQADVGINYLGLDCLLHWLA